MQFYVGDKGMSELPEEIEEEIKMMLKNAIPANPEIAYEFGARAMAEHFMPLAEELKTQLYIGVCSSTVNLFPPCGECPKCLADQRARKTLASVGMGDKE